MQNKTVEAFYDELSGRYTELIKKCVPRYNEMFANLFHYIPDKLHPETILDLGCGTGNLVEAALKHFPKSTIHALDISADILNECKSRFVGVDNVQYHQQDFNQINFPPQSFDLIISTISIHHIKDNEKSILYKKIFELLKPGGCFVFADQTRGSNLEIYEKHIQRWKEEAFKLGSSEENWQLWMQHQDAHDYHAPVAWHLKQLEGCGFIENDVIWKNLLWAVLFAKKPSL